MEELKNEKANETTFFRIGKQMLRRLPKVPFSTSSSEGHGDRTIQVSDNDEVQMSIDNFDIGTIRDLLARRRGNGEVDTKNI